MKTFLRLYGIRAHLIELCESLNIPHVAVNQATWRASFLRNGRADKDMALAQCKLMRWPVTSKDAAEACGVAWHLAGQLRMHKGALPGDLFEEKGGCLMWDEQQTEYVQKAWEAGASASEIATALGPQFTRNAVMGKVHRLGIIRSSSPWTVTTIAFLKDKWNSGCSASEIAAALGPEFSRSSVLGKAYRLKLAKKQRIGTMRTAKPRKFTMPRGGNTGTRAERMARRRETVEEFFDAPELLEIPVEQRKTLLQLNEHTCRWPVGDPGAGDFFFCGGDTANELPYCAYHCRVAYQPPAERSEHRPFKDSGGC